MDKQKVRAAWDACVAAKVFPPETTRAAEFRVLQFLITGDAVVDPPESHMSVKPFADEA